MQKVVECEQTSVSQKKMQGMQVAMVAGQCVITDLKYPGDLTETPTSEEASSPAST